MKSRCARMETSASGREGARDHPKTPAFRGGAKKPITGGTMNLAAHPEIHPGGRREATA